jgi:hypothetical protein
MATDDAYAPVKHALHVAFRGREYVEDLLGLPAAGSRYPAIWGGDAMTRFSQAQYERRMLVTVALYSAFMLFAWPLMNSVTSLWLKALLSLVPVLPMIYLVGLMARRIRTSDEFEQRIHLIALGVATAVTSVLGLVGGFLSIAGVWSVGGSVLIWVFPVIVWSYSAARWYVQRRYGTRGWCSEETSIWSYLRFALIGAVLLAVALLWHQRLDDYRLGFIYGTGAGCMAGGLILALAHRYRQRYRND